MAADDTIRCPHATLPWRIAARKHSKATIKPNGRQNHPLSSRRFGFGAGLSRTFALNELRSDRTASQLLSRRETARMVPNFAQPIILACGTCASAKICRHSVGVWLNAHCAKNKINVDRDYCARPPYNFRSLHAVLRFAG